MAGTAGVVTAVMWGISMRSSLRRVGAGVAIVTAASGLAGCGIFAGHPVPAPTVTVTVPAPSPTTAPPTTPPPAPRYDYTVQPGVVMSAIAAADGVSTQTLENFNPQITDPHWIYPGEVVHLPQPLRSVPAPLPSAPCDGNMSVAEAGAGAAAGTVVVQFSVTNHSGQSCVLQGYPLIAPQTADGSPIAGVNVVDGGGQTTSTPPPLTRLEPGATTLFNVEWSDVAYGPNACVTAPRIAVQLPGQRTVTHVNASTAPLQPCATAPGTEPRVSVGPVGALGY